MRSRRTAFLAAFLTTTMLGVLAACGGGEEKQPELQQEEPAEEQVEEGSPEIPEELMPQLPEEEQKQMDELRKALDEAEQQIQQGAVQGPRPEK